MRTFKAPSRGGRAYAYDESATHTLETWAYDAGGSEWQKLNPAAEPDPSGNRGRQLLFAPELGFASLENCTSKPREQQIWTYSLEGDQKPWTPHAPKPRAEPRAIDDGTASVLSPTRVELRWKAVDGAGYLVERGPVAFCEVYGMKPEKFVRSLAV